MTREEWRRKHIAAHQRPVRVVPAPCHPDQAHRARGLCQRCYERWLYAQHRIARDEATR